jgi:hypothetical protein
MHNRFDKLSPAIPGRAQSRGMDSSNDSAADEDLRRVVHVIVHDFNGDTSAFFESLQATKQTSEAHEDDLESGIVRRFARSV